MFFSTKIDKKTLNKILYLLKGDDYLIRFRDINEANFSDIINLKLPKGAFCAQNIYSLAEAWLYHDHTLPYALYNDDNLVGFIMFDVDEKKRELGIWRLMFAEEHQNKGFGYETLIKIIKACLNSKKYDYIYLYCSPINKPAFHLYKKVGFYETGEIDGEEYVLKYDLKTPAI